MAEAIGRRLTIIIGCTIYCIGVVLQVASHSLGLLVAGRLVAGLGVGFESAIGKDKNDVFRWSPLD